ncbi:MAG: hypothetical protein ACJ735_09240 [Actinomycetes bacterium]
MLRLGRLMGVAALMALLAGCSSSGGGSGQGHPAPTSAAPVTQPATPTPDACASAASVSSAKPPSNIPTPADAIFFQKTQQGSTVQYLAYAPGGDVKQRRDAIKAQLAAAGYVIKGTDAEDNEEAELEFEGKGHEDATVQVIHRPGCETQLRIRFGLHN